ncbi:hypothetical protein HCAG_04057 [Histoplasma mississippiense (nom. inval.)]|uniref:hypothetical protein n=1 Tax=Ajellomyces capsulatus (strain NAm1 / WU24) TaxID=2059318 RepID=UPI000157C103|nr:hypothetical protein HCAG_04057 [Histoplasma mississippiense (nom. inval.)]EDN07547.1 hypothetical protein HCAG_04057 [Histoplasma mississippiense (nom. inval.)]
MADPRPHRTHRVTRSQSRVLPSGSVVADDDIPPRPSSAHDRPPGAFESSINEPDPPETPFRFEAGLNTAPDTVRPAARPTQPTQSTRTTRQLSEAGSHHDEAARRSEALLSDEVLSDVQLQRLMMTFEMEKERRKIMEEKRKALEIELKLEEMRARRAANNPQNADNNTPTTPTARTHTWDPDLGERLEYNLYDPDSRVGKAIAQFKEDVKSMTKPNALTGTSNFLTWNASMKTKLVDAQCWGIIEKQQVQNPLQDPEWAPFWDARNRWTYAFISNSLGANVRPRFIKNDENRIAYTLWRAIEEEYSIPKTQLRREAVLEFTSLGGTQVTNVHSFFDKFRAAIMKLEMMDAHPPDAWVFDIFYSALPNVWRGYVQKKIEEAQESKSTPVVLDVHLLMEEIRSRLDPPKDKKPAQSVDTAANAAQSGATAAADSANNNSANTSNSARGGRSGRGRGGSRGSGRGGAGNPPTCSECNRSHFGTVCWFTNPDQAPDDWKANNATKLKEFKEKKEKAKKDKDNSGGKTQLVITDGSESFQMANLAKVINVPACFVEPHKEPLTIWDSGAGCHIASDRSRFSTLFTIDGPTVQVANKAVLKVQGVGMASIPVGERLIEFNHVYYVPGLSANLISAGLMERQGYIRRDMHVDAGNYFEFLSPTGNDVFYANLSRNNIYILSDSPPTFDGVMNDQEYGAVAYVAVPKPKTISTDYDPNAGSLGPFNREEVEQLINPKDPDTDSFVISPPNRLPAVVPKQLPFDEWHRRLGHIGENNILKMARDPRFGIAIIGPKKLSFCATCVKAKQRRATYKNSAPRRATRKALKIWVDIFGGGETLGTENDISSYAGKKLAMVITDDATRMRWIFLLERKDETLKYLRIFNQFIKNLLGRGIAIIHSDRGELNSNAATAYMLSEGIKWEPTPPHTPQQDGVSERSIGLIIEKARSLLIDSSAPEKMWGEAVIAATELLNLMPTSTILYGGPENMKPITPYEAWLGALPSARGIRRWGCKAFLKIAPKPTNKMASRSLELIFVGYDGFTNYRLVDPSNGRLYISKDVIFQEDLHLMDPSAPATGHPKTLPTAARQAAAAIPSPIPSPTPGPIPSVNDLFIDEEVQPLRPLFLVPTNNWWIDYEISARIPTFLVQNTPISPSPPIEIEDTPTITGNNDSVGESSVGDGSDDLPSDPEIYGLPIPKNLTRAKASPEWKFYYKACVKEVNRLKQIGAWRLIERTPNMAVLRGQWVFDKKFNNMGKVVRYKARWVVCGNYQQKGVNYSKTFAPVVSASTSRALMAISASRGWHVLQIDMVTAFLNAQLPADERIYMSQPTGFREGRGDLVCELMQGLYGLKQAALLWYEELRKMLLQSGFRVSPYDAGLFIHDARKVYMTVYVDDVRLYGPKIEDLNWAKAAIAANYEIKDVGDSNRYLGMKIERDSTSLTLSQPLFITNLLEEFAMDDCHPTSTPIEENVDFMNDNEEPVAYTAEFTLRSYQSGIGSLQYLATNTRPDVSFAAGFLGRFSARPTSKNWAAFKRTLRYLQGTINAAILTYYKDADIEPVAYADADWAGRDPGSRSTTGYIIYMAGGPVAWRSCRQTGVSKSSTEAEYIASSEAAYELICLRELLEDAGFVPSRLNNLDADDHPNPPPANGLAYTIHADNKSAIELSSSEAIPRRSKHIEVRFHILRDLVRKNEISIRGVKIDGFDGWFFFFNYFVFPVVFVPVLDLKANFQSFNQASFTPSTFFITYILGKQFKCVPGSSGFA